MIGSRSMQLLFASVVGAVALYAVSTLSISCSTARAQAAPCGAWQVSSYFVKTNTIDGTTAGLGPAVDLPAGWEPMSLLPYPNGYYVAVRRCAQ
jgi:hypothetical protein